MHINFSEIDWDEIIRDATLNDLQWLKMKIDRRLEFKKSISSKAIIRKNNME